MRRPSSGPRGPLLALALGLSGCSLAGPIAGDATDYNRTVEEAENDMLLLNVVRASLEYPLHFTRIARISGAYEVGASAATEPTLGADETGFLDVPLAASAATRPSFDIQILDSQEFYAGLQTPITAENLDFLRTQGFSLPLLLHALVEEASVFVRLPTEPGGRVPGRTREICVLAHDPRPGAGGRALEDDDFARFDALVELLASRRSRIEFVTSEERLPLGPALPARAVEDVKTLLRLRRDGLGLERAEGGRYRVVERRRASAFRIPTPARLEGVLERSRGVTDPAALCSADVIGRVARLLARTPAGGEAPRAAQGAASPYRFTVEMTLRSTRGLIGYLGELARAQALGTPPTVRRSAALDARPALFVLSTKAVDDPALSVDYRGETYSVPPHPEGGRSLQLLALVKQLFTLNLSAEEFPTSQVVRFVD
jgi:hypothetical protein